jgi:hypothetical protein
MSWKKVLPGCELASFGGWCNAVPPQYVLHRLIRQLGTQIRQSTDDAVISPARVLARHLDHQSFNLGGNRRTPRVLPVAGTVELLGHQSPVLAQDGIRLGNASDLSERPSTQAFANFGQRGALSIDQTQARRQLRS